MHCLNRNLLGGFFSPVKRTSVLYFDLKEFFVCFFEVFFLTSARGMALVTAMLACPFIIYLVHWFGSE